MSRKKTKTARVGGVKLWVIILTIALAVASTVGVFKVTDNLSKNIFDVIYNEDNLVRNIDEYEGSEGNLGNGLKFTVYANKSIHVKGKINNDDDRVEWELGTIVIEEDGVYTLTGMKDASVTTAYLCANYMDTNGNEVTLIGDISDEMSAELVKGTQVTFYIVVYSGCEINTTVKPTFVLGDKAGKF